MERYLPPPTITDLTISGSISGSTTSSFANVAILRFEGGTHLISSSLEPNAMIVDLSGISNSGSWDGTFTGSAEISGSLNVIGDISAFTYYGDGSNLTGIDSGSWNGIFTGSAEISGSLTLEGNISASNEITATIFTATGRLTATNITASIISASGNIITNTLTASSALIENTLQFYTQSVVPTAVAGTLYLDSNYDLYLAQ